VLHYLEWKPWHNKSEIPEKLKTHLASPELGGSAIFDNTTRGPNLEPETEIGEQSNQVLK